MRFKEYLLELPSYRPPAGGGGPAPTVRLGANENPLGPSPRAVAAIREAAGGVNRYPDPGSWPLRGILAEHFDLQPEMVFCTNGSDEAILLLCDAFLGPGDNAVMGSCSFVSYVHRALASGGQLVRVPMRDHGLDLDAMADAVTGQTRVVFLCNPNNPTGTFVGADDVARFLDRVPQDALIVADEAYLDFADRPDVPDLIAEVRRGRPNLLVLRTFAKIYGLAGLRLGYAFGAPDLISYLDRVRPIFNVNALAQAAAPAALADAEHVARSRTHAAACRERFARELGALGLAPIPSVTNFIAFHAGDDAAVAAALAARGIAVNPLAGWGLPGYIRVTFGTDEENDQFFAALRDIVRPGAAGAS